MAYSRVIAIGDGSTTQFAVNFVLGHLLSGDVTCRVGTEVDGVGDPLYRSITFLTENLIEVAGAPAGDGVPVQFDRTVDKSNLRVDYNDGDNLDEDNLMTSQKQLMMALHEALDGRLSFTQDVDAAGFSIINVRDPADAGDIANKQFVLDNNSSASAATAEAAAALASSKAEIAVENADLTTDNLNATNTALTQAITARDVAVAAAASLISDQQPSYVYARDNYHPVIAPDFIRTAFYDADQVAGSGGLYKNNGTSSGDLIVTLADGVTNVGYDLAVERPIIAQFGTVNTLDDREVWQSAINKLQPGDTLAFPAGLKGTIRNGFGVGSNLVDQRASAVAYDGLRALTSSKNNITVIVNGQLDFTSALDDGFRFTGNGVSVLGGGIIKNTSGQFLPTNSTDTLVQWRPSLIRLDGSDCNVSDLHFIDHPTIGVWAKGSRNKIHHCMFEGGPTVHLTGENTVQMSVALAPESGGGYGSTVTDSHFKRSSSTGAAYTAVFSVQPGAIISRNVIENMLEHGVYSYGAGSIISDNQIDDSFGEMLASAIQSFAPNTSITGNRLTGNQNHIALQEASGCRVSGNKGGTITVRSYYAASTSDIIRDLIITENIMYAPSGQFWPIDVALNQPYENLLISRNMTSGGGDVFGNTRGAITVYVTATSSNQGTGLLITENTVKAGGAYSIIVIRAGFFMVGANKLINPGVFTAARFFDCNNGDFYNNNVADLRETSVVTQALTAITSDGNSNIRALDNNIDRALSSTDAVCAVPTASIGRGNSINHVPNVGRFTMQNADASNVTHAGLRTGARVNIFPIDKDAVDLQASADRLYVSGVYPSSEVFQVATSSGAAATKYGLFGYEVIQ
ncbi:phage tail fiber domain-containing protein [Nitrobacteraceae bacterium UC4449_H16]